MTADREVVGLSDEETIKELTANYPGEIVRVIFTNMFSYHLKFSLGRRIPTMKEHRDHTGSFPAISFYYFLYQCCHEPYMGINVSTAYF